MKGQACRMAHIAYVRVSTAEQNEARQIEALADIFADGDHERNTASTSGTLKRSAVKT